LSASLNVVLLQSPGALTGVAERLSWLEAQLDGLAGCAPDLVILPELFQCGYNIGEALRDMAEPRHGAFAASVARLARAHGTAIIHGYAEREGGVIYNSALATGRDGRMIGHHRKLVLPPGFEGDHFAPGDGCTLFDLGMFRVAMLICYDVEFPEALRHVAMAGADLVVVPTALGAQWGIVASKLVPTRAFENGVFVAYANHCGQENGLEYYGGSCLVAPDGRDLVRAGAQAGGVSATIDHAEVARAQARLPYHLDRARLPWVAPPG